MIGELKNQHALDRVRCRGTLLFHVQLLLACSALNYKRLADRVPEAANGVAGTPRIIGGDLPPAAEGACRVDRDAHGALRQALGRPLGASSSSWSYLVCLN